MLCFLPEHIKVIFTNVPHSAAPCDEIEKQRDLNSQSRTSMPPSQVKLCLLLGSESGGGLLGRAKAEEKMEDM